MQLMFVSKLRLIFLINFIYCVSIDIFVKSNEFIFDVEFKQIISILQIIMSIML